MLYAAIIVLVGGIGLITLGSVRKQSIFSELFVMLGGTAVALAAILATLEVWS